MVMILAWRKWRCSSPPSSPLATYLLYANAHGKLKDEWRIWFARRVLSSSYSFKRYETAARSLADHL